MTIVAMAATANDLIMTWFLSASVFLDVLVSNKPIVQEIDNRDCVLLHFAMLLGGAPSLQRFKHRSLGLSERTQLSPASQ
jgi:hypothetical protein